MSLKTILDNTETETIVDKIHEYYPDDITDYAKIVDALRGITPTDTKTRIIIDWADQLDEFIVSGKDGSVNQDHHGELLQEPYASTEAKLAVGFYPWSEWLGMSIDAETLERHTSLEILALCLYEMTYYGDNEEEVQKKSSFSKKLVNMIKEERIFNPSESEYIFENGKSFHEKEKD